MRVRSVKSLDELQTAMTFIHTQHPAPPRGRDYYQRRYSNEAPIMVISEDDAGICAAMLGSVNEHGTVQVDDYIPPEVATNSLYAGLLEAVLQGADLMQLNSLFVPVMDDAGVYEELGCVSTLHMQIFGDNNIKTRTELVHRLRDSHRVLSLGEHGTAKYAQFDVQRVDHKLLEELEATTPGAVGSIWLMNHWVGSDDYSASDGTTRYRRPRYVVTYHPRFKRTALEEVKEVDRAFDQQSLTAPDVVIIPAATPGRDLSDAFRADPPAFVRHLAPVQIVVPLSGNWSDLELIAESAQTIAIDPTKSFAVQCRKGRETVAGKHGEAIYTSRDVEVQVGSTLNAPFNLHDPDQVLSVYLDGSLAYVGISETGDNLAKYADEARLRSTQPTKISRAEHKLVEAIDVFGLELSSGGNALDLGAAPGGWSLVLAEAGLKVTAVDPAILASEVSSHPNVTHIRSKAECADLIGKSYDIVVNDMSIDPDMSATILCDIAPALDVDTPVVLTIKLPTLNVRRWLTATAKVLENTYRIEAIRHLYHNRQEVTALLRRI